MNDIEFRLAEVERITRENHAMLTEILAYTRKVQSAAFQDGEDMRALLINLVADLTVDRLGQPKQFRK